MIQSDLKYCLIVGYGSIGARHCSILRQLGHHVAVVSRRADVPAPTYANLETALSDFQPDLVVIANRTHEHLAACRDLARLDYSGLALIEKPLWAHSPESAFEPPYTAYVGYNMRFHPLIRRIKEKLEGRRVFSAQFSVGQYLPDWRPGTDYRQCYSAHANQGGGVLRDLSHELDLALWMLGPWKSVAARMGRWGNLEISSEDTVDIIAECENCRSLTIHLDYQSHISQRHILIQAEGFGLYADVLAGVLRCNDEVEHFPCDRNISFTAQMETLLSGHTASLCSWDEGYEIVRFMEAIETASSACRWEINI
jgi:predicted dehydrogenase